MKKNLKHVKSFLQDAFLFIGFCAIAYGLYLVNLPLALIICGGMLIFAGIPKRKTAIIYKNQPKKVQ